MHEHGLAKELWPEMQRIAEQGGFKKVTRVDMTVGSLHGVSADFLAHSFVDHAFTGTIFEGAELNISLVDPTQQYSTPDQDAPVAASGWELMITRIEGDK